MDKNVQEYQVKIKQEPQFGWSPYPQQEKAPCVSKECVYKNTCIDHPFLCTGQRKGWETPLSVLTGLEVKDGQYEYTPASQRK